MMKHLFSSSCLLADIVALSLRESPGYASVIGSLFVVLGVAALWPEINRTAERLMALRD